MFPLLELTLLRPLELSDPLAGSLRDESPPLALIKLSIAPLLVGGLDGDDDLAIRVCHTDGHFDVQNPIGANS